MLKRVAFDIQLYDNVLQVGMFSVDQHYVFTFQGL